MSNSCIIKGGSICLIDSKYCYIKQVVYHSLKAISCRACEKKKIEVLRLRFLEYDRSQYPFVFLVFWSTQLWQLTIYRPGLSFMGQSSISDQFCHTAGIFYDCVYIRSYLTPKKPYSGSSPQKVFNGNGLKVKCHENSKPKLDSLNESAPSSVCSKRKEFPFFKSGRKFYENYIFLWSFIYLESKTSEHFEKLYTTTLHDHMGEDLLKLEIRYLRKASLSPAIVQLRRHVIKYCVRVDWSRENEKWGWQRTAKNRQRVPYFVASCISCEFELCSCRRYDKRCHERDTSNLHDGFNTAKITKFSVISLPFLYLF